jgi:hypothetical protein
VRERPSIIEVEAVKLEGRSFGWLRSKILGAAWPVDGVSACGQKGCPVCGVLPKSTQIDPTSAVMPDKVDPVTGKVTHELRAMPFHVDREWHSVEDTELREDMLGEVVILCSDGTERPGNRPRPGVLHSHESPPPGVTFTHWRLP